MTRKSDKPLTPKENRRELIRQQMRDDIIKATTALIAHKGFYAISMDDVATQAQISKGSLYNYFENREELFWTVIEVHFQRFHLLATPHIQDTSRPFPDRLRKLLHLIIGSIQDGPALPEVIEFFDQEYRENLSSGAHIYDIKITQYRSYPMIRRFLNLLISFFDKGIQTGYIPGNDPLRLAIILSVSITHLFHSSRLQLIDDSDEKNIEALMQLFFPSSNQPQKV